MGQLVTVAALFSAMVAVPLAGTAAAEQPANVAAHVTNNHTTPGASENPRASSRPGYKLGKFNPCVLLVLEDKKNRPACRPEFR